MESSQAPDLDVHRYELEEVSLMISASRALEAEERASMWQEQNKEKVKLESGENVQGSHNAEGDEIASVSTHRIMELSGALPIADSPANVESSSDDDEFLTPTGDGASTPRTGKAVELHEVNSVAIPEQEEPDLSYIVACGETSWLQQRTLLDRAKQAELHAVHYTQSSNIALLEQPESVRDSLVDHQPAATSHSCRDGDGTRVGLDALSEDLESATCAVLELSSESVDGGFTRKAPGCHDAVCAVALAERQWLAQQQALVTSNLCEVSYILQSVQTADITDDPCPESPIVVIPSGAPLPQCIEARQGAGASVDGSDIIALSVDGSDIIALSAEHAEDQAPHVGSGDELHEPCKEESAAVGSGDESAIPLQSIASSLTVMESELTALEPSDPCAIEMTGGEEPDKWAGQVQDLSSEQPATETAGQDDLLEAAALHSGVRERESPIPGPEDVADQRQDSLIADDESLIAEPMPVVEGEVADEPVSSLAGAVPDLGFTADDAGTSLREQPVSPSGDRSASDLVMSRSDSALSDVPVLDEASNAGDGHADGTDQIVVEDGVADNGAIAHEAPPPSSAAVPVVEPDMISSLPPADASPMLDAHVDVSVPLKSSDAAATDLLDGHPAPAVEASAVVPAETEAPAPTAVVVKKKKKVVKKKAKATPAADEPAPAKAPVDVPTMSAGDVDIFADPTLTAALTDVPTKKVKSKTGDGTKKKKVKKVVKKSKTAAAVVQDETSHQPAASMPSAEESKKTLSHNQASSVLAQEMAAEAAVIAESVPQATAVAVLSSAPDGHLLGDDSQAVDKEQAPVKAVAVCEDPAKDEQVVDTTSLAGLARVEGHQDEMPSQAQDPNESPTQSRLADNTNVGQVVDTTSSTSSPVQPARDFPKGGAMLDDGGDLKASSNAPHWLDDISDDDVDMPGTDHSNRDNQAPGDGGFLAGAQPLLTGSTDGSRVLDWVKGSLSAAPADSGGGSQLNFSDDDEDDGGSFGMPSSGSAGAAGSLLSRLAGGIGDVDNAGMEAGDDNGLFGSGQALEGALGAVTSEKAPEAASSGDENHAILQTSVQDGEQPLDGDGQDDIRIANIAAAVSDDPGDEEAGNVSAEDGENATSNTKTFDSAMASDSDRDDNVGAGMDVDAEAHVEAVPESVLPHSSTVVSGVVVASDEEPVESHTSSAGEHLAVLPVEQTDSAARPFHQQADVVSSAAHSVGVDLDALQRAASLYPADIKECQKALREERTKRIVAEKLTDIIQDEAGTMRRQLASETTLRLRLESDLAGLKTELRHEKSKSSDLQQRVEELEQSLSGTSLLVKKLETQLSGSMALKGGIDYMLEAKIARGRANEAESRLDVAQSELVQSQAEVNRLLDRLSELTTARKEMVSSDVHSKLLTIADQRAARAEEELVRLREEVIHLRGGTAAPPPSGLSTHGHSSAYNTSYLSSSSSFASSYPSTSSYTSTYEPATTSSSSSEALGSYANFLQQSAQRMAGIAASATPYSAWGQPAPPHTQHHYPGAHPHQQPPWMAQHGASPYSHTAPATDPHRMNATPQQQLTNILGSAATQTQATTSARPSQIAGVARDKPKGASPQVASRTKHTASSKKDDHSLPEVSSPASPTASSKPPPSMTSPSKARSSTTAGSQKNDWSSSDEEENEDDQESKLPPPSSHASITARFEWMAQQSASKPAGVPKNAVSIMAAGTASSPLAKKKSLPLATHDDVSKSADLVSPDDVSAVGMSSPKKPRPAVKPKPSTAARARSRSRPVDPAEQTEAPSSFEAEPIPGSMVRSLVRRATGPRGRRLPTRRGAAAMSDSLFVM